LTTHNVDIVNKLKRRVVTIEGGRITSDQAQGSYRQFARQEALEAEAEAENTRPARRRSTAA